MRHLVSLIFSLLLAPMAALAGPALSVGAGSAGGATCIGAYTATMQDANCSNSFSLTNEPMVMSSMTLSPQGVIQGNVTFNNFVFTEVFFANGSCARQPGSVTNLSLALSGTWNGSTGAMAMTAMNGSRLTGAFTQPALSELSGNFGGAVWGPDVQGTFHCLLQDAALPAAYPLAVVHSGNGVGRVTSAPTGIDCGTSCSASFLKGTVVILTATPAPGSYFFGWSGACAGRSTCSLTMDAAKGAMAIFKVIPFDVVNTEPITSITAAIKTRISFKVSDIGKRGAIFVTARVPTAAFGTVLRKANRDQMAIQPMAALDDTSSTVLIQETAAGWQLVVNGQLVPYTTGVLGDELAAQTILETTDSTSLAGAEFCIGYGTSADAMVSSGNMVPVATVPDPDSTSASPESCVVETTQQNYSDSWWNENESGWGITITDHDSNAFVQWYTYDETGHNQKYVISGGTFSSDKCQFSGTIMNVTGPSWTQSSFDPNLVARRTAGSGTFDFCPTGLAAGTIVFNYIADGVAGSKELTRLSFGNDVPHWGGTANTGAPDFTDLWWNPDESGWGVSVTQHGNNIFFRVFVYDTDGKPLLFIVPGVTFNSSTSFTGAVTLTTGPWFGSTSFDPGQVVRTTAGTATLTFSDANNGTLIYTVNGVTKTKTITRLGF